MFACVLIYLYKLFVLSKVKYSKKSHRNYICQKLGTLEINALGPHTSSAELWLTEYHLLDLWIGNSGKKYRSHC